LTKRNIIIAVIIVAVVGIWRWRAAAAAQKAKAEIKIATVVRKDLESALSVSGKIVSDKTATLTFPVPGKLAFVGAQEGEIVTVGKALLGLNTGDLAAAAQAAYYQYLAADANAKQVEDEVKDHNSDETFVMKNKRVSAQTTRDMAYDGWLTARRALNNATLYAPFAGVVTSMTTNVIGDTVGMSDGVTVVDPTSLHMEVEVDESDVGKIEIGMPVRVTLDAFEDQDFEGTIKNVGFVTRFSSTGATVFPVDIVVNGDIQKKFRLGMNGDGEIILGRVGNVLTLPVEAVNDGKVDLEDGSKLDVKTGMEGLSDVEIVSGLKEGDKVVIK
jgi:HlyD family secretion protein